MKKLTTFIAIASLSLVNHNVSAAGYFKDDFSWGSNPALWNMRSGDNGTPFGCKFNPGMISPSSHGITLSVSNGSCAELQSKNTYRYGIVQGALRTGNTPGTVSSIFTYTSWWDKPGRAWQEIDIEFLPSLGNVVHTNVIYQPAGGQYQSWEQDIDLGGYGLNVKENLLTVGFDWTQSQIRWFVYDTQGNQQTIRVVHRDNGDGFLASNEIPVWAWPIDDTKIMINHWHGDNSADALYFPGQYYNDSAWAYYDFIEYIPH
ncbi:family 16 glycosylhydrolase [Pseudoalteromonas sp. JBTF-M23]|uniref:Family 16 glycosylhydrolase n=1 Tax=Pseudoalteromonas caenipelagi TaxID=2726988 RepID=A0A849VF74_9GAMM|nr:family 16 glycosylhydrolase [Pseudoalteromonas caenipelagi]NOU50574.1 family 16 glycosylhydrolase [Pseudoalteromonas caenipelagi]